MSEQPKVTQPSTGRAVDGRTIPARPGGSSVLERGKPSAGQPAQTEPPCVLQAGPSRNLHLPTCLHSLLRAHGSSPQPGAHATPHTSTYLPRAYAVRPWTLDHPGGRRHGLGPCRGGCRDTQPCLASPVWLSTRQAWGHPHPDPGGGSEGSPALWGRPLGAGPGLGSGVMRPSADPEGPEVVTSPSPLDGRETEAPRGGSVARPPPVPALARPLAQHRSY